MKKHYVAILMSLSLFVVAISGCKKDEDDSPAKPTEKSSTDLFNYSDAYGIFAAVRTVTTQEVPMAGTIEIEVGTAVAAIWENPGSTTYQDMGTVTAEGEDLDKQSSNAYIFAPKTTDPEGLSFSSPVSWSVSGSSNISAFTHNHSGFPSNPTILSEKETITRSAGYTFDVSSVSGADSILFVIASGSKYLEKRIPGWQSEVEFTADEMETLEASSQGLLQVTPYKLDSKVVDGKKLYFVNQVTVSHFAEFK